ncbi:MAG: hypothetical protein IT445_07280 [Phycisphaeraceae bacterium]|nr:hypothetical protein [Phycisphaeraceae bacterium]
MKKTPRLLLAMALLVSVAFSARGQAFSRMVIFGDSLSDTGNIYTITDNWFYGSLGGLLFPDMPLPYPPSPYYNKRFSNGPVWVDYLSQDLGLSSLSHDLRNAILPTTGNGYNYAVGGAQTTSPDNYPYVDMNKQLPRYTDNHTPSGSELFVILCGANNINGGQTDHNAIVNDLTGYISTLYSKGARHFLVSNLPRLGQTPGNKGTASEASKDQVTLNFNAAYAAALDALQTTLPLVEFYRMDFYGLTEQLLTDPAAYGFNNFTDAAFDEDTWTIDPNFNNDYAFWDEIHPTTMFHELIAGAAIDALARAIYHPGDANGDGQVNLGDLQILGDHWQSISAIWTRGDFTSDGQVNLSDLQVLGDNWGFGVAADISFAVALQQAGLNVPEPTALLLLTACSAILCFDRGQMRYSIASKRTRRRSAGPSGAVKL